MQLTGQVWQSSCSALDSSLQSICQEAETICNDGENYYAVAFDSFELVSPYYVDLASNLIHTILWFVRIAIMRYAIKSTHLTSV